MLQIGDKAPEFSLPDQQEKMHKLSDHKGKWILLYFYSKDDTPGCTTEACSVRDNFSALKKLHVSVFGISTDSIISHKKFAEKYNLSFPLLSDEEKIVVNLYGVWTKKSFWGKSFMGIVRTSFLIDPTGKIAKVYEKVNPKNHIAEILKDLKILKKIVMIYTPGVKKNITHFLTFDSLFFILQAAKGMPSNN